MVIGEKHNVPEASNVLAKIIVMDESPLKEKGETKIEFPPLENLDVRSLHQAYLTRLSESLEN